MDPSPTIAVVGAGRLGRTLAGLAVAAGLDVLVAGSGAPARVARAVERYAPGASPARLQDAVDGADVIVLAVPLPEFRTFDPELFDGRIVVDAMNHWPENDGADPEFDDPARPTSTLVRDRFAGARVVKSFNHVAYQDLRDRARPEDRDRRIGIAIAGDDAVAVRTVADLVDRLGFEPVVVGSLDSSARMQPDAPLFGSAIDAATVQRRTGADVTD